MLESSMSDLHFSCEDPFSFRSALLSNISSLKLMKNFMSSKKTLFLLFYTQNIQYLVIGYDFSHSVESVYLSVY